ncbi:uncharacterized protein LOC113500852 [Trichoplusia ni]|uniref:Uncharacterized protein LOC113500852 n=1 Tax=Trichoplusia ni TaxID=7111 RepID=A0A7E5WA73_TRINI|nr:uncharacterized protein LOC113500852 [Trichoplusia ni]
MASFKILIAIVLLVEISWAKPNGNKIDIKIPKECDKDGFCSVKPEGYDKLEEKINSLLTPHLISSFADRMGQEPTTELSPQSDWHNCPYVRKLDSSYTFLYENLTKTDYIIQTKLLSQTIETVTCAYEKIDSGTQQCFQHLGLGAFNMQSTCKTSTAKRSLLIYDDTAHMIVQKDFNVPCCCTCSITNSL